MNLKCLKQQRARPSRGGERGQIALSDDDGFLRDPHPISGILGMADSLREASSTPKTRKLQRSDPQRERADRTDRRMIRPR